MLGLVTCCGRICDRFVNEWGEAACVARHLDGCSHRCDLRLELRPQSRVYIDLRSVGLLRSVGHDPTLSVRPPPWVVDVADQGPIDTAVDIAFASTDIEPPADLSASDRIKMAGNMSGPDVLDAARFPIIPFHGRYVGSLEAGRLSGELQVRGVARRVVIDIRASEEGRVIRATGAWQGRLTELGIRPYAALLGTLRLDDWIRLRVQVEFALR